jgi:membrane-bound ClpP family serine protease
MSTVSNNDKLEFAFNKKNYILMGIGILLLIIGFALLAGGGSTDPNYFSPDIFNTQRLVIAPLFMLAGFILEIYAIMYRKKDSE